MFTGTTWNEARQAGGTVSGFRESRWKTVQRIRPGDFLLCYLTGISRWVGLLEVTSEPYRDTSRIWADEVYPCRVKVNPLIVLDPEHGVPVFSLRDQLSFFRNMSSPIAWTGQFRGSPKEFRREDGEAIVSALRAAQANPVSQPFDERKLQRRPTALRSSLGSVVIPEPDGSSLISETEAATSSVVRARSSAIDVAPAEESAHTEIQWLLLKFGSDLGLDVWVARNDRNRSYKGQRFADIPRMRASLPRQFDDVTNRTVELIDVLWLRGNAIVAAYEVESTTSIYSGLLRMADLLAMQPNLKIPLYLVAPDDRRERVMSEVNRPTFARLSPPLREICRYIPFSALRDKVQSVASFVQYLRPEFVEEIAESCDLEI